MILKTFEKHSSNDISSITSVDDRIGKKKTNRCASLCFKLVDQYTVDAVDGTWAYTLHGLSIRWYPAVTALLVIPVGMVRLMKYLVPFSVVANACLVFGSSAVFYFIVAEQGPALPPEQQAKLLVLPATRWMLFAGSTLCSMEGVGMVRPIDNVTVVSPTFFHTPTEGRPTAC